MKKEKFITVMAFFDDNTQKVLQSIQESFETAYGTDTKTKDIPFHITLGSYPVEEKDEIVSRITAVASQTKAFDVSFVGLNHFGNVVRYMEPEISDELRKLHKHFDSDYANGFPGWAPHATIYRHSEPTEIALSEEITQKLHMISSPKIVGIELGEFFPPKKIVRVLFDC